jgi:hypothetical protein
MKRKSTEEVAYRRKYSENGVIIENEISKAAALRSGAAAKLSGAQHHQETKEIAKT